MDMSTVRNKDGYSAIHFVVPSAFDMEACLFSPLDTGHSDDGIRCQGEDEEQVDLGAIRLDPRSWLTNRASPTRTSGSELGQKVHRQKNDRGSEKNERTNERIRSLLVRQSLNSRPRPCARRLSLCTPHFSLRPSSSQGRRNRSHHESFCTTPRALGHLAFLLPDTASPALFSMPCPVVLQYLQRRCWYAYANNDQTPSSSPDEHAQSRQGRHERGYP